MQLGEADAWIQGKGSRAAGDHAAIDRYDCRIDTGRLFG